MKINNAIRDLALNIQKGDFRQAQRDLIADLKRSDVDNRLFLRESLTSKLVYTFVDFDAFRRELVRMGHSGLNQGVASTKSDVLVKTVERYLSVIGKKSMKTEPCYAIANALAKYDFVNTPAYQASFEVLVKLVENDDCTLVAKNTELSPDARYFVSSLKRISSRMKKGDSPISAVLASIYVAKTLSTTTKAIAPEAVEAYEKSLIPVVIALLNNPNYVKDGNSNVLRDQMLRLASQEVATIGGIAKANIDEVPYKIFHDCAVATYLNTIIDKGQEWETGIDKDSKNPMRYVDSFGSSRVLFANANYLGDEYTIDQILSDEKLNSSIDGLYTILNILQRDINKDNVAFDDPSEIAELLMTAVVLYDQYDVNNYITDIFAYSAGNALIEIEHNLNGQGIEVKPIIRQALNNVLAQRDSVGKPATESAVPNGEFGGRDEVVDDEPIYTEAIPVAPASPVAPATPAEGRIINAPKDDNLRLAALNTAIRELGKAVLRQGQGKLRLSSFARSVGHTEPEIDLASAYQALTSNKGKIASFLKQEVAGASLRLSTKLDEKILWFVEDITDLIREKYGSGVDRSGLSSEAKATQTRQQTREIKRKLDFLTGVEFGKFTDEYEEENDDFDYDDDVDYDEETLRELDHKNDEQE